MSEKDNGLQIIIKKQFQTALSDEGVKYENRILNAWTDFKNS